LKDVPIKLHNICGVSYESPHDMRQVCIDRTADCQK